MCKPERDMKQKNKQCDGRKMVTGKDDDCRCVEETGCWMKFRFFWSCISSRSKVDNSTCGTSTNYGSSSFL